MDPGIHIAYQRRIPTLPIDSSKLSLLILSFLIIICIIPSMPCAPNQYPISTTRYLLPLGSTLSLNQTLLSPNGRFAVGLFSPLGSSGSFYFGIWYAQVPDQTVVWVANREQPVSGNASWCLSVHGDLQLLDAKRWVWSSTTSGLGVYAASLQDTGNLILHSANFTSVWESFQHPSTNVWLQHMRFKRGLKLQSWMSSANPAIGMYSVEMHASNYSLVWNNSRQYWNSGRWTGQRFEGIPEMANGTIYYSDFNNTTGFQYYVNANFSTGFDISFTWITVDGRWETRAWDNVKQSWFVFWSKPSQQCDVFDLCGPNSACSDTQTPPCTCLPGYKPAHLEAGLARTWSGGCEIASPFKCNENGTDDEFLIQNQMSFDVSSSLFLTDWDKCMNVCLKNCSCLAFSYQNDTLNCSLVHKVLRNGRILFAATVPFYIRSVSGVLRSGSLSSKRRFRVLFIVGTLFGASLLLLAVGAFSFIRYRSMAISSRNVLTAGRLIAFSFRDVQLITRKFKEKIGNGAFGAVFKGNLLDGTQVAVKKLERGLEHGEKQFQAEVRTVGQIQHINLVRLIGFCCEGTHRLLVYEYVGRGSLDTLLFNKTSDVGVLAWSLRFNIALGIARAITYLHEECRQCIIHLDIKPENILVDESFCPKLSDFGLAKLMGREFSRVATTMRGTRGYLAPEWLDGSAITAKADVYSYGMMLLEVISGRRNIDMTDRELGSEKLFFPVWAARQLREQKVMKLVDERLGKEAVEEEQVRRMAYAALWCIQDTEMMRPCMSKVVQMLDGSLNRNDLFANVPPIPQALQGLVE